MPLLPSFVLFTTFLVAQTQPSAGPQPAGAVSPSPSAPAPAPGATAAATPSATASPASSATPSAAPSATPSAASSVIPAAPPPAPLYKFVYRAPPWPATAALPRANAPVIDEIDLNDSTLVTPGALHLRVLTSDAVISVTAETLGRSVTIPLLQRGTFAYDGFIPAVPFFLRHQTYNVRFIASVQDGRTALVTLPLTLK